MHPGDYREDEIFTNDCYEAVAGADGAELTFTIDIPETSDGEKLKYAVEKQDSSDQDPVYINGDEDGIVCGKRLGLRLPVGEHEITIERDN